MEEKKAQKIAFFTDLFLLDEPEEEDDNEGNAENKDEFQKTVSSILKPRNAHADRHNPIIPSSQPGINSSQNHKTSAQLSPANEKDTSILKLTSYDSNHIVKPVSIDQAIKNSPKMPRAVTITKSAGKNVKKRKRDETLEVLPENQQIFRGLVFYFFPNSDVSPARRFRMKKARERGAIWVREWTVGVTHIIMDRGLSYHSLMLYLNLSDLPKDIALVTEDFPADCIAYRRILNHDQVQYYPEGYQGSGQVDLIPPTEPLVAMQPLQEPSDDDAVPQSQAISLSTNSELILVKKCSRNTIVQMQTTDYARDALDEAIDEANTVEDLPLDSDEDEGVIEGNELEETEDEQSEQEARKVRRKKYSDVPWQERFSCMHKNDGLNKSENPNHRTIEILQAMLDYYNRIRDQWRTIAYRKAIAALRNQPRKVMTKEEAFRIPNIGKRIAAKIEEIAWTDKLRRLENTEMEPNDHVLQKFMKIYGVGFTQATAWVKQGHRTMEDLVNKVSLTKNQLIGIEHYDDFLTRIPRDEVEEHGTIVRTAIHGVDEAIQVTIGGSYRRGAVDSGDVDFIITKPDCSLDSLRYIVIEVIIPRLQQDGYLQAGLAVTSKAHGSKWHGAAVLPGSSIWRRVDFLLVPFEEMGAALLYFTGNDVFNRSIRLLASKKGFRLNQRGLWKDVVRGRNRERITQGTLVEAESEKRIFEILGVPYRPPEHRIC